MTATAQPVAIVGMGVLLPGAPDLAAYWTNLVEGHDAITDVPPRRWDPRYHAPAATAARPDQIPCRRGGFVDGIATVQPERFGLTADDAREMDPEQLIALQVASEAIDDAGGPTRLGDLSRVGVVMGREGFNPPGLIRLDQRVRAGTQLVHTLGTLLPELTDEDLERVRLAFTDALGPTPVGAGLGVLPGMAAAGVACRLGLGGPAYTVDASCASALVAVDAAVAELTGGRCDVVLAGGTHHNHDVTLWSLVAQLGALSTGQHCRPFHTGADGLLLGEGTGVVVLKRLADAVAAGDRVYAVIRGTGVSGGGQGRTVTDPDLESQLLAVTRAWAAAGIDPTLPDALGMIEAHGSGIPRADATELEVLRRAFGPADDTNLAVVGSVKSMIGHTMAAAGIAGLIKAALAVHRGVLLPTLNCEQPHPALEKTRFRPLTVASPWVSAGPRRAGVSAFGLGGANAHVVLEQHGTHRALADPTPGGASPQVDPHISVTEPEPVLRFAAPTAEALAELLDGDDATLRQRGARVPDYLGPGSRLGMVGPTARRLSVARRVANGARGGGWAAWRGRNDVWLSSEPLLATAPGRIAFVYPGLEAEFSPRIDDVCEHLGMAVPELSADGIGQHGSSVLRIARVLERALHRMGVEPDALAGHSVGEWSAMYASGMFDEADADGFVFGAAMDDLAVMDIDYASLACPVDQALRAIADYPDLVLSHDNAPQQTVVCGPPESIRALATAMRRDNVLVQVLPFRSGFHTPMLAPCLGEIARRVAELPIRRAAGKQLWSATLVDEYPTDPDEIRALFLRHLVEPVRFRPMVLAMYHSGVRVFLQIGQGRLGNLVDDVLGPLPHLTIAANASRRTGLDQLRRVAVALWVDGGAPDFTALDTPSGTAARPRLAGAEAATRPRTDDGIGPQSNDERCRATDPGHPAADAGRRSVRVPVRLDCGPGLVSLAPGIIPPPTGNLPASAALAAWAEHDPVASELLALVTDTTESAVEVLERAMGTPYGERDWLDAPEPVGQEPIEATTTRLRVCLEDMPYLTDHCLAPQRAGWPEPADRHPVLPATTLVRMMADLAEKSAPGRVAVSLSEIRFERWLPAAPATEVTVGVQPIDNDTVSVAFGEFARATIRLADRYSAAKRPLWPYDGSAESPPPISGPDLYRTRWMFHGPAFRGVMALAGHSDQHVRAVLTPTSAPGSLLDAAGQLLAYFAKVQLPERNILFPAGIERIDVYAPEPAPGTPVDCLAWIAWQDNDWLRGHLQLSVDGTVITEVTGWLDRRFDLRPETEEAFRFPERHAASVTMPGGWTMVSDMWSDLASREIFAWRYLGRAEHEDMQRQPPRNRRPWLLGRIAAKDAVRSVLWDAGRGPVFPAELRVTDAGAGALQVEGQHGLDLPPVRVSLAHSGDVAVAIACPVPSPTGSGTVRDRPAPRGPGIDVEEVRRHRPETVQAVLTTAERHLLATLADGDAAAGQRWFTRIWTAKEAAARSLGTDLGDDPRRFTVGLPDVDSNAGAVPRAGSAARTTSSDRLLVTAPSGVVIETRLADLANPPYLAARSYVAAWTAPDQATQPLPNTSAGGTP